MTIRTVAHSYLHAIITDIIDRIHVHTVCTYVSVYIFIKFEVVLLSIVVTIAK